jgi:hypothetical protein
MQDVGGNQGVVKHDVCLAEEAGGAHGEEIRSTRSGAYQIDGARPGGWLHRTSPAATV